jgi:hypothetical protein
VDTSNSSLSVSSNKARRRAQQLAALLGLVGAAMDLSEFGASTAVAQSEVFRSAAGAPAAWLDFAMQLQRQFQDRLASDSKAAAKLAEAISRAGAAPATVIVLAWISPDGRVERLVFDYLDGDAAAVLRAVLDTGDVGLPPPDMPQPLHLRLSLRPKPELGQGQDSQGQQDRIH